MIEQPRYGWTLDTMKALMDERFAAVDKALRLQAGEYERRLDQLNGERERERAIQATYVTQEKFDSYVAQSTNARELALERVDERFREHVKRYEMRQREIDEQIIAQRQALDKLIVSQQNATEASTRTNEEATRRFNRNLAIATIIITLMVALANGLFPGLPR